MELVPIVILTLKVVSVLAILVLGISFISFKIRQKTSPEDTITVNKERELKPNFVDKTIKRITRITREFSAHPAPPPKKEIKRHPVKEERKVILEKKNNIKQKSKSYEQQPRVEVVKASNPASAKINSHEEFEKEKKIKTELKSLNGNVLDNYIDEDEDKLFALKANKKNPK